MSNNTTTNSGKRNRRPRVTHTYLLAASCTRSLEESTPRSPRISAEKALSSVEFQNIMKRFELEKQAIKKT